MVLVDAYFVYWYIYSFRLLSGTPVLHKFESIMSSFEPVHQNKRHDEKRTSNGGQLRSGHHRDHGYYLFIITCSKVT